VLLSIPEHSLITLLPYEKIFSRISTAPCAWIAPWLRPRRRSPAVQQAETHIIQWASVSNALNYFGITSGIPTARFGATRVGAGVSITVVSIRVFRLVLISLPYGCISRDDTADKNDPDVCYN
jgi:hypothetical protein